MGDPVPSAASRITTCPAGGGKLTVSGGLVLSLTACSSGSASTGRTARFSLASTYFLRHAGALKRVTAVSRGEYNFSTGAFAITTAAAPRVNWGRMMSADNGGGYLPLTLVGGVKMVQLAGYSYQQVPSYFSGFTLPRGKTWTASRLPLGRWLRATELSLGLGQLGVTSPYHALSQLAASSSEVTFVGPAQIRGTKAREYRLHLDMRKLAVLLHALHGKKDGNFLLQQAEWDQVAEHPLTVWIDSKGRLGRLLDRQRGITASGTVSVETEVLTVWGYGKPIDIKPPPAREVYNAS